jgi:hypothetical protein
LNSGVTQVLGAWSRALHACDGQERRLSLYRGADDAPGGTEVGFRVSPPLPPVLNGHVSSLPPVLTGRRSCQQARERDGAVYLGAVLALTPGGGGGGGAAAHARHNLAEEELLLDWCLRETQAAPGPRTNRTRRVPHPVLIGHAASAGPAPRVAEQPWPVPARRERLVSY